MAHMTTSGTTFGHHGSPLAQTQRRGRLRVVDSPAQLSQRDQTRLKAILTEKYEHVHDPQFEVRDAEQRLFAPERRIARPDTSWYHPVMDNLTPGGREMSRRGQGTTLLTAEQERHLFLQFNYCRYRVVRLKTEVGDGPVTGRQAREILHWFERAEGYRDQLAQTNLALVLAMAKRTRMSEVDFADLVSEGNMALLRAVDKFDVGRGFKFSTYACRAILKAFSRTGVKLSKYRAMFPTDFDPKLERSDFQEEKNERHEAECVDEIRLILHSNRADLTDIEREVIEHRFALGRQPRDSRDAKGPSPLTLEQVGRIIGVTKERVRQIQNKALEKLRVSLEHTYLT
jgi:RNA polymerase primary sigma factor